MMNNASVYYHYASYVQKEKIASLLFSNIVVSNERAVIISVKDQFKPIFSKMAVGDETIANIEKAVEQINLSEMKRIVSFYSKAFPKRFEELFS